MRVLLVTDWPAVEGGAERYVEWLREGLAEAGDDVRLLVSSAGSAAGGTADYVARAGSHPASQAFLQLVNPDAVRRARRAVREFRPDVVHVTCFETYLSPAIFAAFRGVPTVVMLVNYKPICPIGLKLLPDGLLCAEPAGLVCLRKGCIGVPHWLRDRLRYPLLRSAIGSADRVLATSESLAARLREHGVATEAVRHGVPPPSQGFRRAPAAEPRFLFVGRLSVEKGPELLLRAFARLAEAMPESRLRIGGDGPLRDQLEGLSRSLGIESAVSFLGHLDLAALERELSAAWALVAPSLWAEPFGLIAIDAIVRGVPVVASATGGFAESVAHGHEGLLVRNGDESALFGALEEIAQGRSFPDRAIDPERVRDARARYSLPEHIGRLRQVLMETAESRAGP